MALAAVGASLQDVEPSRRALIEAGFGESGFMAIGRTRAVGAVDQVERGVPPDV